jgi:hypothetical protein
MKGGGPPLCSIMACETWVVAQILRGKILLCSEGSNEFTLAVFPVFQAASLNDRASHELWPRPPQARKMPRGAFRHERQLLPDESNGEVKST